MSEQYELTILRFAHAFATGAGTETYLADVDSALLQENSWKIIRCYLTYDQEEREATFERIGKGLLVKVPLLCIRRKEEGSSQKSGQRKYISFFKNTVRDHILYNRVLYDIFFHKITKTISPRDGGIVAVNAGDTVRKIIENDNIDLVVMHYIGGTDSAEIIHEVRRRGVPYVVINHYSNDRFDHLSIREQSKYAAGIAGVSNILVPRRLQDEFVNLADGIDTEFFQRPSPSETEQRFPSPLVFLPARITESKGQADLIQAVASLKANGIRVSLAFAGRVDSPAYFQELKKLIQEHGLEDHVHFLGELDKIDLKKYYALSSVLGFPTYHHEGLPRILLETQAMEVPPISYTIGGIPHGLVDNETGFLVKLGDVKEFTWKLQELITDDKKRQEMGRKGRAFIEKYFSLQALASRHKEFYLMAINKTAGRTRRAVFPATCRS